MNKTVAATRSIARQTGAAFYYAPQPCKHGHAPVRYTESGKCVECTRAAKRRFNERKQAEMVAVNCEVRRSDVAILKQFVKDLNRTK